MHLKYLSGTIKTSYSSSNTYQDNCANHDTSEDYGLTKEERRKRIEATLAKDEFGNYKKY